MMRFLFPTTLIRVWSRTGYNFGCDHDGGEPDIITRGKGIAGGFREYWDHNDILAARNLGIDVEPPPKATAVPSRSEACASLFQTILE